MFYTGITSDLRRREYEHNHHIRSPIQKGRLPFKIIYTESYNSREDAARREKEIKGWSRQKKIKLIERLH